MSSILKFNRRYFMIATVILSIEICIAVFAHDRFVRPYLGDFLVVVLIYCSVKSFLNIPVLITALSVLIFSFAVETLQYFNIVAKLGLQNSKLAKIIIGSSFEWSDLILYTTGIAVILLVEKSGQKIKLK